MNKYYEIIICVYLKNDVHKNNIQEELSRFINYVLEQDLYLRNIHLQKNFKQYSFSDLTPFEKGNIYKGDEMYNFKIRTWNYRFANLFSKSLYSFQNDKFIVTSCSLNEKTFNENIIKIKTVTPAIITMKDNETHKTRAWYNSIDDISLLYNILLKNLEQKYNTLNNSNYEFKVEDIFKEINILKPLKTKYKQCKFLAYILEIEFFDTLASQSLAKIAYVNGIGGKNSAIGSGFVISNKC
ncbi:CRISPR-associated endoribonuclease Cas6 [Clostridium perfringens]|uniref:CRISPR-associated endoribonuclease Cas6 n=1 Tax=Clostridium perfringens TaxID=1502 RepID=UPI003CF75EB1